MDQYGIPSALKIALAELEARDLQTGRTERMLDQVTDGDVIVALTEDDCAVIRELLSRRNCKACVVGASIPMTFLEYQGIYAVREGNIHFDHAYATRYYRYIIEQTEASFARMHERAGALW
jgi:hypothetical protein